MRPTNLLLCPPTLCGPPTCYSAHPHCEVHQPATPPTHTVRSTNLLLRPPTQCGPPTCYSTHLHCEAHQPATPPTHTVRPTNLSIMKTFWDRSPGVASKTVENWPQSGAPRRPVLPTCKQIRASVEGMCSKQTLYPTCRQLSGELGSST